MNTWLLISIVLYLTPLLSILTRTCSCLFFILKYPISHIRKRYPIKPPSPHAEGSRLFLKTIISKTNLLLGCYEYTIRTSRNYIMGFIYIMMIIVKVCTSFISGQWGLFLVDMSLPLFFLIITFYTFHHDIIISLQMAEFLRMQPAMHPEIFFRNYHAILGPFSYSLPDPLLTETVSPENISFKKLTHPKKSILPFLSSISDTAHLAHISLKTLKYIGKDYAREVFDIMASMWGKRILHLVRARFETSGLENFNKLDGKIILVLNHKSQLDFVLTFFALSSVKLPSGRNVRPRFITAKDHFVDNPLVYDVLGVGKLIETVDMVFIERTKMGKGIQDLQKAAQFLAEKNIDITIFPQGTRAEGNIDRSGKRRDAGYYTTVPPKDIHLDLGHLRKGCAYLAVDTLFELAQKGEDKLHLVFLTNKGTASVLAKQSFQMQTEIDVKYNVGGVLTLSTEQILGLKKPETREAHNDAERKYLALVNQIHQSIDEHIVASLQINESLKHRFLLDLQGHFRYTPDRINHIEKNLDLITTHSPIAYQILDRIYACPPHLWNPRLSVLSQLLLEGSPMDRLKKLRDDVTLEMFGKLKTKLHGKKVKKKKLKNT